MTAWWNDEFAVMDTETDGPDPQDARIIQWCVGVVDKAGAQVRTELVQPEREIPAGAVEVHGISTERATAEGRSRVEGIVALVDELTFYEDDVAVVGHNLSYDLTVIDREMRRTGVGSLGIDDQTFATLGQVQVRVDGRVVGGFWVIDTMVIDKAVDRYRPGPKDPVTGEKTGGRNKLVTVAEFYGVPMRGDAHSADADALAAGRVAWAIAKRASMAAGEGPDGYGMTGPAASLNLHADFFNLYADRRYPHEIGRAFAELGRMTLPNLHHWQAEQAREQADSFRAYCEANPEYVAEKEIDVAGITGDWPLRPITTEER